MKKQILLLGLPLFATVVAAQAQQVRTIQGAVVSADKKEALPGATVIVQGTSIGISTDVNGQFSLPLPASAPKAITLRISSVGFLPQDVAVTSDNQAINVVLTPDTKQLEDVVVIGYAPVQRKDLTQAVSSVNAQQIKDIPISSAADALTGRLAGVQVTSSEGAPGPMCGFG